MSMFSWRLRLVHEGNAGIVLERSGRRIRFDPVAPLEHDDVVILTGADPFAPERSVGFHTVVRGHGRGEVDTEIDGVRFEGLSFEPVSRDGGIRRWVSAARQPSEAARRWLARRRPDVATIWRLTFENGEQLVHLGGAFHGGTDVGWAADVVTRFGQPKWLIASAPFGHAATAESRLPAMAAEHVLLADLDGDLRRAAGRPTELVTPLADRLEAAGLPVMVFVPGSSIRFE